MTAGARAALPVKISATGGYIPSLKVDSTELDGRFGFQAGFVERATGIRTRYYGNETETAPYMGARAVADALRRGDISMKEIDALISVAGTQAQLVPCTASLILEELGELDSGIAAFDINATCLGFIVGFDVAAHLIAAGRYRRVLLVAAETCSVMLSPTEWESASIVGDGAAAVVLDRAEGGEASCVGWSMMATYPRGARLCETRALGTTLHPNSPRKPTPEDYHFHMDGLSLVRLTSDLATGFRDRFMSEAGQSLSDFDLIVPHQASGPAVRLMMKRLECPKQKVFLYLRDFGNVASASIPFGIHLALEGSRLKRGDRVLLVGTGAGVSLGALSLVY